MQSGCVLRFILLVLPIIDVTSSIVGKLQQPVKLLAARNRAMLRRLATSREEKSRVCYDLVGCFADPPPHLPIKRSPEHPNVIQTGFYLSTRANQENPELLQYGDDFQSISRSTFNATKPLKVLIHGYKGSGSDVNIKHCVKLLLDLEDANIIVLDWTRGAATTYTAAVANSELVGRQLALIFLDAINLGTNPADIHAIGFSLGAHVAGCASEVLKKKNLLMGRITGLDPASPLFRHHLFREKSRKLDATDAALVDVIHTDGSQDFTDGFGLLKPIGHVDFFPNGGREQPGCVDVKNSVVVSHLKEELLTRDIACSHIRAWQLFVESVLSQTKECKFIAWPCPQGGISYNRGTCFPMKTSEWSQEMGYATNRGPLGIYYLPTRAEAPFCGKPLRASLTLANTMPIEPGILFLKIFLNKTMTLFKFQLPPSRKRNEEVVLYNIAAANFDASLEDTVSISGIVSYQRLGNTTERDATAEPNQAPWSLIHASDNLRYDKLYLEDREGHRWAHYRWSTFLIPIEMRVEFQKESPASL